MNLYVVTAKAQEETTVGVIERIEMVLYGVYTTEARAQDFAEKYGGTVVPVVADQEKRIVAEHWLNPGYVQSSS